MKKKSLWSMVAAFAVILAAVGLETSSHASKEADAAKSLKVLTQSTDQLESQTFYQDPSSNLAIAQLNRAEFASRQTQKQLKNFTAKQKQTYTLATGKLSQARLYAAASSEASNVLGADKVITDTTYENDALNATYLQLKAQSPQYAKALNPKVDLIDLQVQALAALKKAQSAHPEVANVLAAENAIKQVPISAFQKTYLPIIDHLKETAAAAEKTPPAASADQTASPQAQPKTNAAASQAGTAQEPANEPEPAKAPIPAKKPVQKPETGKAETSTPAADDVKAPDEKAVEPAKQPAAKTPAAADADVKAPQTGAESLIGVGGLYDSMDEAVAAMKQAQAAGAANRPASAYSLTLADGSQHYSWEWTTNP